MTTRADIRRAMNNNASIAYYDAAITILMIMPTQMLNLLDLPSDVRADIEAVRGDDDSVGRAAAYFGFLASNYRMTPQDSVVAGQALHIAASNILAGSVAIETEYDRKDILLNPSYAQKLKELITDTSNVPQVNGARIGEELGKIKEYVEQYDREITDQSQRWIASGGGTNEDESATRQNWLERFIDAFPGVKQ